MSDDSSHSSTSSDRIEVTVPLRTTYLSTLRTIAASLGADAGFSIDEIDDVRLGLGEVMAAYIERAVDGERATATFFVEDRALTVQVAGDGGTAVELDDLARGILDSVLDRCDITPEGVTLVKQATEAHSSGAGRSSMPA